MTSIRTAWRIGPLLEPGERLIWLDRATDHPAAWLGAVAFLAGGGAAGVSAGGPLPGAAVLLVGGLAIAMVRALRGPTRASYAATDRGRAFVVERDRTLVFHLPETIGVRGAEGVPVGELDLGTLEVRVLPEGRSDRVPIRLRAIRDPAQVAERLRRREPVQAR